MIGNSCWSRGKVKSTTDCSDIDLLETCCRDDGTVLDPFVGSGTTMRVALQSGKNAIGIDLSPDFCNYLFSELRKL